MKPQHLTNVGTQLTMEKRTVGAIYSFGAIALLLFLAMPSSLLAQTVKFESSPVRVTVGLGATDVTTITNAVNVATNPPITGPITFNVTGLPPGAGYTLTDTNGNDLPSTSIDTNLVLTVFTTNIAQGVYTFNLNASGGATNTIPFVLQAAYLWNGSLNAASSWNNAGSWVDAVRDRFQPLKTTEEMSR